MLINKLFVVRHFQSQHCCTRFDSRVGLDAPYQTILTGTTVSSFHLPKLLALCSSFDSPRYIFVPDRSVCVCVCVFFPFILDVRLMDIGNSRGHTGFLPFCSACLDFSREKDAAVLFLRRS